VRWDKFIAPVIVLSVSPLTLFALGRTAGWIGRALEQYRSNQLIRPRAKYTGPRPRKLPD
jgi:citrate synthase